MKWTVKIMPDAKQDLKSIHDYIANIRSETATADRLVGELIDSADSLDFMPFRYPAYPNEPWKSRGLRIMYKHKYAILYLPDEPTKTVAVIRVVYGGRDIDAELNE